MENYTYKIYSPGGNDTALVFGLINDINIRHFINNEIMKRHSHVEQVGFVSTNFANPELIMAGGEFCGNATRAATFFYLNGQPGTISIKVSGVEKSLNAGIDDNYNVWAEMPVNDFKKIKPLDEGTYLVDMEGISHLVLLPHIAKRYLDNRSNLKEQAKSILESYQLTQKIASGVVFLSYDDILQRYSIHPCVYVSSINTMFYETACGSGTIASGLVLSSLSNKSVSIPFIQPSGNVIIASIHCSGAFVQNAFISGFVNSDETIYSLG